MKEHNFQLIHTNGIRLRTVVEGKGPLVILLHERALASTLIGMENDDTCR